MNTQTADRPKLKLNLFFTDTFTDRTPLKVQDTYEGSF